MGANARVAGVWRALEAFGSEVPNDPKYQVKSHVRLFIDELRVALGFTPIVTASESR